MCKINLHSFEKDSIKVQFFVYLLIVLVFQSQFNTIEIYMDHYLIAFRTEFGQYKSNIVNEVLLWSSFALKLNYKFINYCLHCHILYLVKNI